MEKYLKSICVLLFISILLNFYTISKINDLREIIGRDVGNLVQGIVEDDLEDIKEEIKEIKEDQQWISKIDVEHVKSESDIQLFKFNWNIKKYKPGSEVIFYCKNSEEDTYEQLMVETLSQGNYSAELQFTVAEEPEWIIRDVNNEGNINTLNVSSNIYEYYVALNDGAQVLTSSVENINLSKLSKLYSTIHAEIMTNKDNEPMEVKLFSEEYEINTEALILEIHNGNSIEELKADGEKLWGKWVINDKAFDKLIIRAEYEDGKTFMKEIWNKSN